MVSVVSVSVRSAVAVRRKGRFSSICAFFVCLHAALCLATSTALCMQLHTLIHAVDVWSCTVAETGSHEPRSLLLHSVGALGWFGSPLQYCRHGRALVVSAWHSPLSAAICPSYAAARLQHCKRWGGWLAVYSTSCWGATCCTAVGCCTYRTGPCLQLPRLYGVCWGCAAVMAESRTGLWRKAAALAAQWLTLLYTAAPSRLLVPGLTETWWTHSSFAATLAA